MTQKTFSHTHAHDKTPANTRLAPWIQKFLPTALTGVFLLLASFGEQFFGFSEKTALFFFLPAYLAGGYEIGTHAIPTLLNGKFDTDVLMLAAALGAAILGEWQEGAFLLLLFNLGHAGEHYALDRARNAVQALGKMMPATALQKKQGKLIERSVESLKIGDTVLVRPGDRVAVDGVVLKGESAVDQSPVTGESVPVLKSVGDEVFAGTVNQDAALELSVVRLAKDNTLKRIIQMVAEAQNRQSPTQQFTEWFTRRFVPLVLISVLATILVPPLVGQMPLRESFYRGMLLLVAASPCALALGTPAAVLAGIAQAARNGVLIKGGIHLEKLGTLQVMAFDKTGTLTKGKFTLTDILPFGETSDAELLRLAGGIEQSSAHPLGLAIVEAAQMRGISLPIAENSENIPGHGVKGLLNGVLVEIGSLRFFGDGFYADQIKKLEDEGKTTLLVRCNEKFLGILALADTPRPHVEAVLEALKSLGMRKLVMLTGDHTEAALRIGNKIGMTDTRAALLPEDKQKAIRELRTTFGSVAMVGDGINDAPALAAASVGIAMGGAGTAVALETADVALMADDLSKLPFAVGLSRASRAVIWQNLVISLGVIALLVFASFFGQPALSQTVFWHEGSSLLVVLNALRLLGYQDRFNDKTF